MNLLRFLKSTKGAIKPLNALALSGVATVSFFFIANTAANRQIQAQRQVRSLGNIAQTSPYEGMRRQDGMLTSINVRDGRNQIANSEELAAMQGNSALDRYAANQRALDGMESSLGRMAQFSDSDDGLNTGNRDVIEEASRYTVGNPNVADVSGVAASAAQAEQQAQGQQGQQGQLAPASMARASGSSFNASAGPISGGNSGASGNGGIVSSEGPRRLSGSMPGGSNIVSQMGLDSASARANSSSFGRDRNGRGGRGRNVGNERDELKDILKKSAAADANIHASANEGGRAFLANARTSGGITVDGASEGETASSADLTAPTQQKLKAVGNRLDEERSKQEERNRKHRALIAQLILTTIFSVGAIFAASKILSPKAEHKDFIYWMIAGAFIAAVTAANGLLFAAAKNFIADYGSMGGTFVASLAQILAPLAVGAMVQTALQPDWKQFLKNMKDHFISSLSSLGMGMWGRS